MSSSNNNARGSDGRAGWVPLGDTLDFLPSEHEKYGPDRDLDSLDDALDSMWADEPTDVGRPPVPPAEKVATVTREFRGAPPVTMDDDPFGDMDEPTTRPMTQPRHLNTVQDGGARGTFDASRPVSRPRYRPDPELIAAAAARSATTAEFDSVSAARADRDAHMPRRRAPLPVARDVQVTAENDAVPSNDFAEAAILRPVTDARRRAVRQADPGRPRGPERTVDRDLEALLAGYVGEEPASPDSQPRIRYPSKKR